MTIMYIYESDEYLNYSVDDIVRMVAGEFSELPEEDVRRQEQVYHSLCFASVDKPGKTLDSFFWNKRPAGRCCMFEALVTTYNANSLKCHLFSTYRDNYAFAADAEA